MPEGEGGIQEGGVCNCSAEAPDEGLPNIQQFDHDFGQGGAMEQDKVLTLLIRLISTNTMMQTITMD